MRASTLAVAVLLILPGCSREDQSRQGAAPDGKPGHVWKDQVEALDKAKGLEADINRAFRERAEQLDAGER